MTPIKIINTLSKFPRRSGLQTEATLAYRTMQKASDLTFGESVNSNNIVMLALLHNINNITGIDESSISFCTTQLSNDIKNNLKLFTIGENESSENVFERIICSVDLEVLYVYLASCYIKTYGYTYNKERIKWLTRAGKVIEAINELS